MLQMNSYLNKSRDNLREHLEQTFLRQSLNYFGEHLDGSQIDGIVCRLNDGTQHLNALLRVDGGSQGGGGLLCGTHHLNGRQKHSAMLKEVYV